MPLSIECFRCHRVGLVRLETVVRADHVVRNYHCGRCDYAWSEADHPVDADRRKPSSPRRPRHERRKADAS